MSATSWSKFYWNDWRSDPRLRMCSIAARGLWIELLAIMAEASPRGYLLVNGQKPDTKLIRTLAGIERNHVGKLLQELEEAGVFSRTENGVIFSRRMVRDEAKIAEHRHWGSLGGNPNLKARDKAEDKPDRKVEDKGDLIPARARPSPSPERKKKEEEVVGARKSAAPPSGGFAFEGRIIKLNAHDLEQWRSSFSAIPDMEAELQAIDAKLADNPPKNGRWFGQVGGWLKSRHEKLLAESNGAAAPKRSNGGFVPLGVGG